MNYLYVIIGCLLGSILVGIFLPVEGLSAVALSFVTFVGVTTILFGIITSIIGKDRLAALRERNEREERIEQDVRETKELVQGMDYREIPVDVVCGYPDCSEEQRIPLNPDDLSYACTKCGRKNALVVTVDSYTTTDPIYDQQAPPTNS